jgi:hypothetical protein
MALSVASGRPCLGRFPCTAPGTALIYLAEDSLPRVRERINGICRHRSIDPAATDLLLITAPSLHLDQPRDRDRLAATVAAIRPRLLLLDPLVRLHRLDENSASEISRLLSDLRQLERTHGTAVMLVHHARKTLGARPGQGLRGSSDLWAWGDSNAYLARKNDGLTLTLEHRHLPAPEPVHLRLNSDGETRLDVTTGPPQDSASDTSASSLEQRVLAALDGGRTLTRTALRAELRVQNQRLGAALEALEHQAAIRRSGDGWSRRPVADRSVPHPSHRLGTEHCTPSEDQP